MGLKPPRSVFALSYVAFVSFFACPALSDEVTPSAAEDRFREGVDLMEKGQLDQACPILEESLALEPRPGTLYALADCEAQRGRVATAVRRYTEYLEAYDNLQAVQKAKHAERAKMARAQKQDLEPVVPKVTLILPKGTPTNTAISVDGQPLSTPALNAPIALDPGDHVIATQARGGPLTETPVTLLRGQSVQLDVKVRLAPPAPGVMPPMIPEPLLPKDEPAKETSNLRVAAFVSGGVGVAGLVVGAVSGGVAMSNAQKAKADCIIISETQMRCLTAEGVDAGNSSRTYATVSTGAIVVGGVGLLLGSILFALDKPGSSNGSQASARVRACVGVDATGGGLSLEGVW